MKSSQSSRAWVTHRVQPLTLVDASPATEALNRRRQVAPLKMFSSPAKLPAARLRVGFRAENTKLSGELSIDAYIYRAALWCRPCMIKALVAERKPAPGAIDISPAEVLQQIVSANGFTSESDYDSDDLPKGPYAEGGGEADAPQHCDGCGQFLGNPLTVDGLICVENVIPRLPHDQEA
ncbi:MAG: hypothetical protein WA709_36975, partial [Stellaceae bacterium]